jgi:hypothetical protein
MLKLTFSYSCHSDLAFARGKDVFASVGADGSVRMFDLRSLEHSTIIYESPDLDPLLRLEWNKQDPNYMATFMVDSRRTIILDIRVPSLPVSELGQFLRICMQLYFVSPSLNTFHYDLRRRWTSWMCKFSGLGSAFELSYLYSWR